MVGVVRAGAFTAPHIVAEHLLTIAERGVSATAKIVSFEVKSKAQKLLAQAKTLVSSCQKLQRGHRDVTSWRAATRIARPLPGAASVASGFAAVITADGLLHAGPSASRSRRGRPVVGEGVETTLAARQLGLRPAWAWLRRRDRPAAGARGLPDRRTPNRCRGGD